VLLLFPLLCLALLCHWAAKKRDSTATPVIAMEQSYEDDFVDTFPQHQQPLEARHVTLLESIDNATKYAILLAIICALVVQFGGKFLYSNVFDVCRGECGHRSFLRECRARMRTHMVLPSMYMRA
jgi:hypothetical protein